MRAHPESAPSASRRAAAAAATDGQRCTDASARLATSRTAGAGSRAAARSAPRAVASTAASHLPGAPPQLAPPPQVPPPELSTSTIATSESPAPAAPSLWPAAATAAGATAWQMRRSWCRATARRSGPGSWRAMRQQIWGGGHSKSANQRVILVNRVPRRRDWARAADQLRCCTRAGVTESHVRPESWLTSTRPKSLPPLRPAAAAAASPRSAAAAGAPARSHSPEPGPARRCMRRSASAASGKRSSSSSCVTDQSLTRAPLMPFTYAIAWARLWFVNHRRLSILSPVSIYY
jgi:hypothetical protein